MKTDELIHLLAADATPVARHRIEQRFALATLAGLVGAGMALMAWFGLRPDLAQAAALPMFWGKLMFAASLAVAGLALLRRMARPGATLGLSAWWLAVPPLVVWAMAAWALWQAAGQHLAHLPVQHCGPVGAGSGGLLVGAERCGAYPPGMVWCWRWPAGGRPGDAGLCIALPRDGGAVPGGVVPAGHGHPHGRGGCTGAAPIALVR
jgi:hypothetical protein